MLERGIAEGWITPPRRSGLTPAVYCRASLSTAEVLDEDRGWHPNRDKSDRDLEASGGD